MRVQFTRPALIQLGAILDDLRQKSPKAADRLASNVRRAEADISAHPYLGRKQEVEGVRRKVIRPGSYLIYYSVNDVEDVASILTIIHSARQRPYDDA